jgi:hypothetical protein
LESDKALARKVKRDGNELFGIVYATAAAIGFNVGDRMICGVISNNRYNSWGHAVLALILLVIGFATAKASNAV